MAPKKDFKQLTVKQLQVALKKKKIDYGKAKKAELVAMLEEAEARGDGTGGSAGPVSFCWV